MTTVSQIYNQIITIPVWVVILLIGWMALKAIQTLQQKSLEKLAQKKLGLGDIKLESPKTGVKNDFLSSLDLQEQLLLNKIYSGGEKNPDQSYRQLAAKKSEPKSESKNPSLAPSPNKAATIGGMAAGVIGIFIGIIKVGVFFGLFPGKL